MKGDPAQYEALLQGIGDAQIVLLGGATHGTHEFYRERAFIMRGPGNIGLSVGFQ